MPVRPRPVLYPLMLVLVAAGILGSAIFAFMERSRSVREAHQADQRAQARLCTAINEVRLVQVRAYEFFRRTVNQAPGQTRAQRLMTNKFFDEIEAIVAPVPCSRILPLSGG